MERIKFISCISKELLIWSKFSISLKLTYYEVLILSYRKLETEDLNFDFIPSALRYLDRSYANNKTPVIMRIL